ncbi:MAG: class I SAM-dependent methyltransferase [Actinomycetota bacterium]|nr:class I SAM-dependent methyltransferase [Actinomycetota bacterium]
MERHPVTATVWGRDLSLVSGSGVFAAGRLDTGTAVLFRATDPPADGTRTLLDLGCGYGVIACALAAATAETAIWAVDVNDRALELTAENTERIGAGSRMHVAHPDAVPEGIMFDEIWSNPPVRIGKAALHDLLLRWLPRLAPSGKAVVVVGKNLGADSLQRWLRAQGWPCDRLASAKGFRVLEIRPRRDAAAGV